MVVNSSTVFLPGFEGQAIYDILLEIITKYDKTEYLYVIISIVKAVIPPTIAYTSTAQK